MPNRPTETPGGYLAVGSSAPAGAAGAGLYTVRYDGTGALRRHRVLPIDHPSYTAADPARGILHAVIEHDAGQVVSFRIDPRSGSLVPLATAASGGALPCHLAVHPSGSHVFAAHYGDGVLSVLPTAADGPIAVGEPVQAVRHPGGLTPDGRLTTPRAHMAAPSPDGRFLLCTDLGTDRIHVYAVAPATGLLTGCRSTRLPPGRGPRHLVFHPSNRYVYLLNELSSTLTVCTWDAPSGRIEPTTETRTRRDQRAPNANYAAAVRLSEDGRFLYTTNRGDDSISVHAVHDDGAGVELLSTVSSGGSWPRDIALCPGGNLLFCANQRSDTLTAFHRDPATGHLSPAGRPLALVAPTSVLPIGPCGER
ncbi:lactonase family protein [Kitasatospora xanthocidica]|uniref:lactonase family protein n=1 Tax=Kitasatospora xanthocidica TaxID=83382 RepID=UPI0036E8ABC8